MINREQAKKCVGKGWHGLIDEFYDRFPDASMEQVKEKYGTLRLYHNNATRESLNFEDELIDRSQEICELCGKKVKQPILDKGWIYALCNDCYGDKKQQRTS